MRIIHTSDWHLGRLFYGMHLTDDQAHVLGQFVDLVKQEKPDAVIIAGDIYDRTVPPPDAVSLLDEVLTKIAVESRVPVIMIAGNHDSPQRVAFGSRLLRAHDLHVVGMLGRLPEIIVLNDAHGPVYFAPIPYAEPAAVREALGQDGLKHHNAAMRAVLEVAKQLMPGHRSVLIAHAFVAGCDSSESVRPLSVGGSEFVDCSLLEGFNYVALGHLHRPQKVEGKDHIRYSGSLLKYSFDECTHQKSVLVVDLDAQGTCSVRPIPLSPRRDVRTLCGSFHEILSDELKYPGTEDYLCIELLDTAPILDAMGRLRKRFANVMHIERPALSVPSGDAAPRVDHRKLTDLELFRQFCSQTCGTALDEPSLAELTRLLEEFSRKHEEAPV